MHLGEWYEMIDIELAGISEHPPGVGVLPTSGDNLAPPRVKSHPDGAFLYQHFLPGVLAVAILVYPVTVEATVIWYGNPRCRGLTVFAGRWAAWRKGPAVAA